MTKTLPRRAIMYLFFEIGPPFILGIFIFIFILLMFQALRLTEFVMIHGISPMEIGKMMLYMAISFLPAIFPMSLLFATLMTYGRLSGDSELIALKSCGVGPISLILPALLLSFLIAWISAQTSFYLAPWGNRQFELLITKWGKTKAGTSLREGTFAEGFFNLVVYTNKVDSKSGLMENVFIYDERQPDAPLTILAKKGEILQDPLFPGHAVQLRLHDGSVHKNAQNHTKVNFETYDLKLFDPIQNEVKEKTPPSLNLDEIQEMLVKNEFKSEEDHRMIAAEFHKRWSVTFLCIIFALLGLALGTNVNNRQQKTNSFVTSLVVVVSYWIVYIMAEGFARSGKLPINLAIWLPNLIFFLFALFSLKKVLI